MRFPACWIPLFWYPQWTSGWTMAYLIACMASSALIAGLGSWVLARRLARTGVLDSFPLGRERVGV